MSEQAVIVDRMSRWDSHGDRLTPREGEIVALIAEGLSNKQIAAGLKVSEHTVKFHVFNACAKVGTRSRVTLAVMFVRGELKLAPRERPFDVGYMAEPDNVPHVAAVAS